MNTLDCETIDSTLESIASAYSTPRSEIKDFLEEFDIDAHYKSNDPPNFGDYEIRSEMEKALRCTPKQLDRVCWFHLTRTLPTATFEEGIQPLSKSLDMVWATIHQVFLGSRHQERLVSMQKTGVADFQYHLKSTDNLHSGPYGMLVKDTARLANAMGNHDYLEMPEIMEDICNGYQTTYQDSIRQSLTNALVPRIVKFWSNQRLEVDLIGTAAYYVYLYLRGRPLSIHANTCFDGKNIAVKPHQILSIESVSQIANHRII